MQDSLFEEEFKLHKWMMHTLNQIRERFATQKVYPRGNPGPYKSYRYINEERRKHGKWASTGSAYSDKELYAKIYNAANGDTERIDFFYRHALDFVKMGVGSGRKLSQATENSKTNKNPFTLFAQWGMPRELMTKEQRKRMRKGYSPRKSRPGVRQEIYHQITRLRTMASIHYGHLVSVGVIPEDIYDVPVSTMHDKEAWIEVEEK